MATTEKIKNSYYDEQNEDTIANVGEDLAFSRYFSDLQKSLLPELQRLDLSINETKIMIFLMIRRTSYATEISRYTGIGRTETYHYLSSLLAKGVVLTTFDRPQKYYALPYREAVDCLVQAKQNALRVVSDNKEEYQDMINNIIGSMVSSSSSSSSDSDGSGNNSNGGKDSYQVVVGQDSVNAKIKKMIENSKEDVVMLLSDKNLMSLYRAEITDELIKLTTKGIKVKLQTPFKNAMQYIVAEEENSKANGHATRSKNLEVFTTADYMMPLDFVLVDGREAILLYNSNDKAASERPGAFWTNSSLIIALLDMVLSKVSEKRQQQRRRTTKSKSSAKYHVHKEDPTQTAPIGFLHSSTL